MAYMLVNQSSFHHLQPCSLGQILLYSRPKPIDHLLQALVDVLLYKGFEPGLLFSHYSLRWHIWHACKRAAGRGEGHIIKIQPHRAAANDVFAALTVFGRRAKRDIVKLQVRRTTAVYGMDRLIISEASSGKATGFLALVQPKIPMSAPKNISCSPISRVPVVRGHEW